MGKKHQKESKVPDGDLLSLSEIHVMLEGICSQLGALRGRLPDNLRPDTVFDLGLAWGHCARAKALAGRDIDDRKAEQKAQTGDEYGGH